MTSSRVIPRSRAGSFYGITVYLFEHAFFRLIFVIVALLVVVLLTHTLVIADFQVEDLEAETLFASIYHSPDAISYVDPITHRTYPGVIDLTKLTDTRLDMAASFSGRSTIAAEFAVLAEDGKTVISQQGLGKDNKALAKLNSEYYNAKYALASGKVGKGGSATLFEKKVAIFFIRDPSKPERREQGILRARIIVANR